MAQIMDEKTTTFPMLVFEFMRLVIRELKGRTFEYVEVFPENTDGLVAAAKSEDVLKVLPDIAREFASRIKPEWTRCYKMPTPPEFITFTGHDPFSGLSIRGMRHFDVMVGEMRYRFDARFN